MMNKHLLCFFLCASMLSTALTQASSFRPMGFASLANDAELIVIGTVLEQEVLETGKVLQAGTPKRDSEAPLARRYETEFNEFIEDTRDTIGEAYIDMPRSVDAVEGGLMLFTKVTLKVEQSLTGKIDSTLSFVVAGGDDGETIVTVHGMPTFNTGDRYMIFLRRGYEQSADPIMGVNKGFFAVEVDEFTGQEVLRTSSGDMVADVVNDRIELARHQNSEGKMQLGAAPVPERGKKIRAGISARVAEYWDRYRPVLTLNEFVTAVHSAKEAK